MELKNFLSSLNIPRVTHAGTATLGRTPRKSETAVSDLSFDPGASSLSRYSCRPTRRRSMNLLLVLLNQCSEDGSLESTPVLVGPFLPARHAIPIRRFCFASIGGRQRGAYQRASSFLMKNASTAMRVETVQSPRC